MQTLELYHSNIVASKKVIFDNIKYSNIETSRRLISKIQICEKEWRKYLRMLQKLIYQNKSLSFFLSELPEQSFINGSFKVEKQIKQIYYQKQYFCPDWKSSDLTFWCGDASGLPLVVVIKQCNPRLYSIEKLIFRLR